MARATHRIWGVYLDIGNPAAPARTPCKVAVLSAAAAHRQGNASGVGSVWKTDDNPTAPAHTRFAPTPNCWSTRQDSHLHLLLFTQLRELLRYGWWLRRKESNLRTPVPKTGVCADTNYSASVFDICSLLGAVICQAGPPGRIRTCTFCFSRSYANYYATGGGCGGRSRTFAFRFQRPAFVPTQTTPHRSSLGCSI